VEGVVTRGKSLTYLSVLPDDYDPGASYPLIIMVHGFGASMQDLAGLAPAIDRRGYVYACPNAPIEMAVGPGMAGYAWMPPGAQRTPQHVQQAETQLEGFFTEVLEQYGVEADSAVLLGFSQGGAMTYRTGLGGRRRFAGLAALSAAPPGIDELDARLPEQRTQPIFIGHGTDDPLISIERAREARDWLTGAGYCPLYHEYAMAHEISQQELDDLVPWIRQTIPADA
jgi:phospholipase/carboxylesterase